MQENTSEMQGESRSERVAMAVTPYEKGAVRALAAFRSTTESDLLRSMTLDEITTEFERVRAKAGAA